MTPRKAVCRFSAAHCYNNVGWFVAVAQCCEDVTQCEMGEELNSGFSELRVFHFVHLLIQHICCCVRVSFDLFFTHFSRSVAVTVVGDVPRGNQVRRCLLVEKIQKRHFLLCTLRTCKNDIAKTTNVLYNITVVRTKEEIQ